MPRRRTAGPASAAPLPPRPACTGRAGLGVCALERGGRRRVRVCPSAGCA
jgi:hypothetical protein